MPEILLLTKIEVYQDPQDKLGWWGYRLYYNGADRWTTDTGLFESPKEAMLDAVKHLGHTIKKMRP